MKMSGAAGPELSLRNQKTSTSMKTSLAALNHRGRKPQEELNKSRKTWVVTAELLKVEC